MGATLSNSTVLIDGTVITNKMGVTFTGEDDLAEPVILDNKVSYKKKTNVPGFIIHYAPEENVVEPDWSSYNGKLAVIQEDGGARRAYSEIQLRGVGNYKIARDGGDVTKDVEFFASRLDKS